MFDFSDKSIAMLSRVGINGALGLAAAELGEKAANVRFLSADLGAYAGLSRFASLYPDKYINTGIAEQNMIGVAAGLAAEGRIPFAVTYASFAVMRCADQIRVCLGEMGLGVKLVGTGAGLSLGILGSTHMGLEDLAVIRAIPGITIFSPADALETIKAIFAASEVDGPVYLRLTGNHNSPLIYKCDYDFHPGKIMQLRKGKDLAFLSTGSMVWNSLKAAEILASLDIDAAVINVHTLRPFNKEILSQVMDSHLLVTVEEHSVTGGLGSLIAEELADRKIHPPLLRLGATDYSLPAEYNALVEYYGLDPDSIAKKVAKEYQKIIN